MLVACKPTARVGESEIRMSRWIMDGPSVSMSLRAETSRRNNARHGLRC